MRIGTAAWAIPSSLAQAFPADQSALARYASVFNAAEINSTFRRSHRAQTYERWAASVPPDFRFSVKTPQVLTHAARLVDCRDGVRAFLAEISYLGPRLGPILLQLPPSLAFDAGHVEPFCEALSNGGQHLVVCEPRHASWFDPRVEAWLAERRIARVASDPGRHTGGERPGGWRGVSYYRLHGSPRVYYSAYSPEYLSSLVDRLTQDMAETVWCVFDNTASGAAAADALKLKTMLSPDRFKLEASDTRRLAARGS